MPVRQQLLELARTHGYGVFILPAREGEDAMGTLRCLRAERLDLVAFGPTVETVSALLLERLRVRASFEELAAASRRAAPAANTAAASPDGPTPGRLAGLKACDADQPATPTASHKHCA